MEDVSASYDALLCHLQNTSPPCFCHIRSCSYRFSAIIPSTERKTKTSAFFANLVPIIPLMHRASTHARWNFLHDSPISLL